MPRFKEIIKKDVQRSTAMIETKRLIFRRWTKEDAAALYALASDPEVGPHAGWPVHTSIEESRAVIKEYFSNDYTWALVSKQTGAIIGCMGYYPYGESNIDIGKEDAEVGYCTEALYAMIGYCFNVKRFQTLWADYFIDNPASGRVMDKCGFTDTGKKNYCSRLLHGDDKPICVMRLDYSAYRP